jgi:hypothetical protein
MIYLTAIGLAPCGSSTVHRTTQNKQYIEKHKYLEQHKNFRKTQKFRTTQKF